MKISGKTFLHAITNYFNQQDTNLNIYFLIFSIIIIILGLIYLYSRNKTLNKDPFEDIPEKDMEILKQISAQKGLSSFDRDFLIMQALNYYVKPTNILLDKVTFENIEKKLEFKLKKDGLTPDSDENLKNMRRLKSKLFI